MIFIRIDNWMDRDFSIYSNITITFEMPINCLVNHSKVFIPRNNLIFNTVISYYIVHYAVSIWYLC